MKSRYALDQTHTKNEAERFLREKYEQHKDEVEEVYGFYKGNGKQETIRLSHSSNKHKLKYKCKCNQK